MTILNEWNKDAVLFLEENGFVNNIREYTKTIIVDSDEVLVCALFVAERSTYDSTYSIISSVWPRTQKEKRLDTFDINKCSFDISIFKKLMSNIDLLCKQAMFQKTSCFYNMEFGTTFFYASCCHKHLPEKFYK